MINKIVYCPYCNQIMLYQHPKNPDMWQRWDKRLPQFPGGFCMFCGKEYDALSMEIIKDVPEFTLDEEPVKKRRARKGKIKRKQFAEALNTPQRDKPRPTTLNN